MCNTVNKHKDTASSKVATFLHCTPRTRVVKGKNGITLVELIQDFPTWGVLTHSRLAL